MSRFEKLAEYHGVDLAGLDDSAAAIALGCDVAYITTEPALPSETITAIARLGGQLSEHDREEAQRLAAFLLHARDD